VTPVRLVTLDNTDSTMLEAERMIASGLREPVVISARTQTGGIGRHGRPWSSPPGNLHWTAVIPRRPEWPTDHGPVFAAGLAVTDLLLGLGLAKEQVALKWPNDALVNGRKIAGTLARSVSDPAPFLVVGIGVNVSTFPDGTAYPATSLRECGIAPVDLAALRDALTRRFWARLDQWLTRGLPGLLDDYRRRLGGVGAPIRVTFDRDRTDVIEGTSHGVDDQGALRLLDASGQERTIVAGDVL
jgi:BirA family transcriptional regulator, biotin operon repressor / biotin---[acetyl-CoA-carboxylase] ligase